MNFIDVAIVLILLVAVSMVVYLSFIKNRNNRCKGCMYYKSCKKNNCENNK